MDKIIDFAVVLALIVAACFLFYGIIVLAANKIDSAESDYDSAMDWPEQPKGNPFKRRTSRWADLSPEERRALFDSECQ